MRINISRPQAALISLEFLISPASAVVIVPNGYTVGTYASVVNYSRVETMAMDPATRTIYLPDAFSCPAAEGMSL